MTINTTEVLIIGAGAAGMMCAAIAAQGGKKVLAVDQSNKLGKKILMSGGGRCNFTNYQIAPDKYISQNPHFCKSALSRYTQWDFIELVKRHRIAFHEKSAGQLFCDESAKDIVTMLHEECLKAGVEIKLQVTVDAIEQANDRFVVLTNQGKINCQFLVIATGGLSIPSMGSSPFGYRIAEQFGLSLVPTRAGLVPITLQPEEKARSAALSGISLSCRASVARQAFHDQLLFTHRGLSGPAILQISSYWQPGESLSIDLLPGISIEALLLAEKRQSPKKHLDNFLQQLLPKQVVVQFFPDSNSAIQQYTDDKLRSIAAAIQLWQPNTNSTEGYRTAEVTIGGVDTNCLSSKTMEVKSVPGLYFIGEVVDVTGWLGGYNFQWAWSSAWVAGDAITKK